MALLQNKGMRLCRGGPRLQGEGGVDTDMMRVHPMTHPTAAPQIPTDAAAKVAAEALMVLQQAWAYYTPETPVATRVIDAPPDGVLAYYAAA